MLTTKALSELLDKDKKKDFVNHTSLSILKDSINKRLTNIDFYLFFVLNVPENIIKITYEYECIGIDHNKNCMYFCNEQDKQILNQGVTLTLTQKAFNIMEKNNAFKMLNAFLGEHGPQYICVFDDETKNLEKVFKLN